MSKRKSIRAQLHWYKRMTGLLALATITLAGVLTVGWVRDHALEWGLIDVEAAAPHKKEIETILSPLRYSGLPDLLSPETTISVDFAAKTWTLHHIHHFDKDGNVVLKDGRYGLCGDLAAYVYTKVIPILGQDYDVSFLWVATSNYFPPPDGSHVVLKITERGYHLFPEEYILDPSFRIYRRAEYFDDYLIYSETPSIEFRDNREDFASFPADISSPILIRNDGIATITVASVNDKFDKNNFVLTLDVTRRYKYFSRTVLAIQKQDGVVTVSRDERQALEVFTRKEYAQLTERLSALFEGIE